MSGLIGYSYSVNVADFIVKLTTIISDNFEEGGALLGQLGRWGRLQHVGMTIGRNDNLNKENIINMALMTTL